MDAPWSTRDGRQHLSRRLGARLRFSRRHTDPRDLHPGQLQGPEALADENGEVFARGLVAYGADELRKLAGKRTTQIEATLGYRGLDEAVHRDDLAVL